MSELFTSALPQYGFDPGYINGFNLSSPTPTTLLIQPGNATDSTNSSRIQVASAITINTAVTGLNGLDVGTIANNSGYYVYIVNDPTGYNVPGAVISLNPTTPTLPAGLYQSNYAQWRRIGFVATQFSSTNLINFVQNGNSNNRQYTFDGFVAALNNGSATTYTSVPVAPMSIYSNLLSGGVTFTVATAGDFANVRPTGFTNTSNHLLNNVSTTSFVTSTLDIPVALSSGAVSFDYNVTNSGDRLTIVALGFAESL